MSVLAGLARALWWVVAAAAALAPASAAYGQDDAASDHAALVALHDATGGPDWHRDTNWKSDEPLSTWYGVTVDASGRVTELRLANNRLSGALPAELADLKNLRLLVLSLNYELTGALPDGLRELSNLVILRIEWTEACAPDSEAFQTWLETVSFSGLVCPPAAESVIDVAVFYTPAVSRLRRYGGDIGVKDEIDLMIAGANSFYSSSGVDQRVRLVAAEKVEYAEAEWNRIDLARFRAYNDGHMDEVHEIRRREGADIAVLLRRGRRDGLSAAYLMTEVETETAYQAFGTVTDSSQNDIVFAHELGHVMGLHHDRYVVCSDGACERGALQYGYGYVNEGPSTDRQWRTIMAYDDQCRSCGWLGRFSNAEQTHLGDVMGIPGLEPPAPSRVLEGPVDAARALNRVRGYVARFSDMLRPPPVPATDVVASNPTWESVDVAWTLPEQPPDVTVERVILHHYDEESDGTWAIRLPPETTSATARDLTAGTTYTFWVTLEGAGETASNSEEVTGTTLAVAPEPATELTASNETATSVDLSWTLPQQPNGVTVNAVLVQQPSDGYWGTTGTLASDATKHTVTGLTANTSYRFRVTLETSHGNVRSASVKVKTASVDAATGLSASNPTHTTVDLAWVLPEQPDGVTVNGVEVQRGGTDWTTLATLAADATSHTVTGLSPGTAYSFRIRLDTSAGNADSAAVAATTLAVPPRVTGPTALDVDEGETAVATLTAEDTDPAAADLRWSMTGGADRAHFALGAAGALSFVSAKDYEAPDDADADGTYEVSVQVTDGVLTGSADLRVSLANVNEAPEVDAGPDQVRIRSGTTVTLSGSASDPEGDALTYAWTQTSGESVKLSASDALSTTFEAPSGAAELVFMLRATDGGGLYGEDDVAVSKEVSKDAALASLSLTDVDIGTFAPETTSYDAGTVDYEVETTTVSAEANDAEATVSVAGATEVADGWEVALSEGDNEVAVTVTAEDGTTTRTYAVSVRRAPAGTAICRDGTALADPADHPELVRDCETLLSLKDELDPTDDMNWGDQPGFRRLDLGEWDTVVVRDGRVREIAWDGTDSMISLSGVLPAALGDLDALEVLRLDYQGHLHGGLPETLRRLSRLKVLDLGYNWWMDAEPLPAWLGEMTSLRRVRLHAHAPGPIPDAWSALTRLEDLELYAPSAATGTSGPIAAWLGELPTLRRLVLNYRESTGRIPLNLAREFDELNLSFNALTGCVPAQLAGAENVWVSEQGRPAERYFLPDCALAVDAGAGGEVSAGATVDMSATASGHHGDATLVWSWTQTSGPAVALSNAATATPSFVVPARGAADVEFAFSVAVSDAETTSGSATATVVYRLPGFAGTAVPAVSGAGSYAVEEGDTAVATLTANDPDTAAEHLTWRLSGGADAAHFALGVAGALAFKSAKDYEAPDDADGDGVYAVSVEVSDGLRSGAAALTVSLTNRNEAPTADAGSDQASVAAGATVTLSGSATDPDAGDTLTYAWTQVSGPTVELSSAASAQTTFAAPAAGGALTFRLRATDAGGLDGEDEASVAVLASTDAALTALTLSGVDIGNFDAETTAYTAEVDHEVASTTVTAVAREEAARVGYAPSDADTATAEHEVLLVVGETVVKATVTAPDGTTTRTYVVTVTRAELPVSWGDRLADQDVSLSGIGIASGVWSDGDTVWVSDWEDSAVRAYALDGGARRSGKDLTDLPASNAAGLWSDGTTLWVADFDSDAVYARDLARGAAADGSLEDLDEGPTGVWSDGATLWVSNYYERQAYAYALSDGTRTASRDVSLSGARRPFGLWSDGQTLLAVDWTGGRVRAYRLSDGARLGDLDIDTKAAGNARPMGMWSDGETLWVTDEQDDKLYAYAVPEWPSPPVNPVAEEDARPATGLAAEDATATTVRLSWTLPDQPDGVTVTGVQVQRETGGSWTTMADLGADATVHTATGLTPATSYTFRVRTNTNRGAAESASLTASTAAAEGARPATDLAASGETETTVDLAWTLPVQPEGVTVSAAEVQSETAGSWTTVATLGADATTHTATGLEGGTTYRFRVRLVTSAGNADSAAVTATTEAERESPITGFTLVDGDDGSDIGALEDGDELETGLGALDIRADLRGGPVGSMQFELSGAKTVSRTENIEPYELFGGQGGEEFGAGSYALTVTPYAERGLGGVAGVAVTVSFTVAAPAPSATVDADTLTLTWTAPRDTFAPPHGSDFAVRVDGGWRPVVATALRGSQALLTLSAPVMPQQAVRLDYLGSAMHPLMDAGGVEVGPWTDLRVENVTGRGGAAALKALGERGGTRSWPEPGTAVASLSLAEAGLVDADLARLAGMADLERLDLSGNALTDVSALSGLLGLRSVDLSGNAVSDLWPLAGLMELRRLDVSGNRVADLAPLAGLPNLEVLVVDANLVADAGALTHLARLENLGLADNAVADLEPLADLASLRRLDLGGNPARDASPLGDLGTLVWLRLPETAEAPAERLVRLRWLWSDDRGECLGCAPARAAERDR